MYTHITFKNLSAVKDTIHLVETIKETLIPHNFTLASFDITNLYTNIPIAETLEILENMLKPTTPPPPQPPTTSAPPPPQITTIKHYIRGNVCPFRFPLV